MWDGVSGHPHVLGKTHVCGETRGQCCTCLHAALVCVGAHTCVLHKHALKRPKRFSKEERRRGRRTTTCVWRHMCVDPEHVSGRFEVFWIFLISPPTCVRGDICVWGDTCETHVCSETRVCGPRQGFTEVSGRFGAFRSNPPLPQKGFGAFRGVSGQVHTPTKRVLGQPLCAGKTEDTCV